MSVIHQVYCTHCTYGSSALERGEGQLADRVLGYSARAGSLEGAELQKCFRRIERLLYYYLPTDTPADEKQRLLASDAPKRLVYFPSIDGLKLAGQVAYRPQDTAGRPGSYFGHFLLADRESSNWSVLDCLKLWGADWVAEDSASHPFELQSLAKLSALLPGRPAVIDDGLLLRFLHTPPGGDFHDPHQVIPHRLQLAPQADRRQLLTRVLDAYVQLNPGRRENVLLVAEPALAALLFYGVARLTPPGQLREEISFSTYEHDASRLPALMAATTFHNPHVTDLKPEAYRSAGYALNTFLDRQTERHRPAASYPTSIVETLLTEGWAAVDLIQARLQSVGVQRREDIELVSRAHRIAPSLLNPNMPLEDTSWQQSPMATSYLAQTVLQQIEADGPEYATLRALVGSPRQLLILELISAEDKHAHTAASVLLEELSDEQLSKALTSTRIPLHHKLTALRAYVHAHQRLPDNCEPLWSGGGGRGALDSSDAAGSLLTSLLSKVKNESLLVLYARLQPAHHDTFLRRLLCVVQADRTKQPVFERILSQLPEQQFVAALRMYAAESRMLGRTTELGKRLQSLLEALPDATERFEVRLDALNPWLNHFPSPNEAEVLLGHWNAVLSLLASLQPTAQPRIPGRRLSPPPKMPNHEKIGLQLAKSLRSIMLSQPESEDRGIQMQQCIRKLGVALLGTDEFLPPEIWNRVDWFLETAQWSPPVSAVPKKKKPPPRRLDFLPAVVTWISAIIIGGAALVFWAMASIDSSPSVGTAQLRSGEPAPPAVVDQISVKVPPTPRAPAKEGSTLVIEPTKNENPPAAGVNRGAGKESTDRAGTISPSADPAKAKDRVVEPGSTGKQPMGPNPSSPASAAAASAEKAAPFPGESASNGLSISAAAPKAELPSSEEKTGPTTPVATSDKLSAPAEDRPAVASGAFPMKRGDIYYLPTDYDEKKKGLLTIPLEKGQVGMHIHEPESSQLRLWFKRESEHQQSFWVEQGGTKSQAGTLAVKDHTLQFEWKGSAKDFQHDEAVQRWLRGCVIRLKYPHEEFVALYGYKAENGTFINRAISVAPVDRDQQVDLYLGGGTLHRGDSEPVRFAVADRATKSESIELGDGTVVVELARDKPGAFDIGEWTLTVRADPEDSSIVTSITGISTELYHVLNNKIRLTDVILSPPGMPPPAPSREPLLTPTPSKASGDNATPGEAPADQVSPDGASSHQDQKNQDSPSR